MRRLPSKVHDYTCVKPSRAVCSEFPNDFARPSVIAEGSLNLEKSVVVLEDKNVNGRDCELCNLIHQPPDFGIQKNNSIKDV